MAKFERHGIELPTQLFVARGRPTELLRSAG
jgi:hypothetical protein